MLSEMLVACESNSGLDSIVFIPQIYKLMFMTFSKFELCPGISLGHNMRVKFHVWPVHFSGYQIAPSATAKFLRHSGPLKHIGQNTRTLEPSIHQLTNPWLVLLN
jgi:hypothetical protein